MPLRFIVTAEDGTVAGSYMDVVVEGESIVIGRGEGVDLRLPDPSVSLRHLEVRLVEGGWVVEDLGSRLGSRLNGRRLEAGRAVPLGVGDKMEVGVFNVVFEGERGEVDVENTRMVARSLVRRLKKCAEAQYSPPYLLVQNGPAAGARFDLRLGAKLRIGRGRDCEIMVDDARTSRVHATVHNQAGAVWLADAGSANGSYLDGKPVTDPVLLQHGSVVSLGGIRLVLVSDGRARSGWTEVLEASREQGFTPALGLAAALVLGSLGLLIAVLL